MHLIQSTSLCLALVTSAVAQHPCHTNLVPNGDFESVFVDPWTYSGPVVAIPRHFRTNGVELNQAFEFSATALGTFSIDQPTPLNLNSGVPYELSMDLWLSRVVTVDIGLTANSSRTSLRRTNESGLVRLSFIFTAAVSGPHTLDVRMGINDCCSAAGTHRVDNVAIREHRGVSVNFPDNRNSNRLVSQTVEVMGPPNRGFALFLSLGGFSPAFPFAPCSGDWMLTLPAYTVIFNGTNSAGLFRSALNVPPEIGGVPLYWQVVLTPPSCAMGCPSMIGFG